MITFSRAKTEEASDIKKLLYETWTSTYSDIYPVEAIQVVTSEWHSVKLLTKQIQDPKAFFGVAKDKDKIIGMCNASLSHRGTTINIQRLHVAPVYQRQGIGSRLMSEAINHFSSVKKADLEVERQNNRAIAFYKKHGFSEAGKKVFTVKNVRIPCIVMEKKL